MQKAARMQGMSSWVQGAWSEPPLALRGLCPPDLNFQTCLTLSPQRLPMTPSVTMWTAQIGPSLVFRHLCVSPHL